MDNGKTFAKSFRRVLYHTVLLDHACQYLKMEAETPSQIAAQIFNIEKAIQRLYTFCKRNAPDSWAIIEQELDSDNLHDTHLLLDEIADIKNVMGLVEDIRRQKAALMAEQ